MQIMGIVNVTPDSFSDGGQFGSAHAAVDHAMRLVDEGADIIDVGGESTRPNAEAVSIDEELRRVLPVIVGIRKHNATIPISIDTYKASVAAASLDAGATMVNDISAGRFDEAMFPLIRQRRVPYILMHMQGEPRTMQANPSYTDVVTEVKNFLQARVSALGQTGAPVYIDPGIGFGKTTEHNLQLLRGLENVACVGPLVLGISRKRFLADLTGATDAQDRDVTTAIIHAHLCTSSISICRVHNVQLMQRSRMLRGLLEMQP